MIFHNTSMNCLVSCLRIGCLVMILYAHPGVPVEAMAGLNPIQRENARAGTDDWRLNKPAMDREIEGYASRTSVNRGERISLFIRTTDPSYRIDLYRMGWYGGTGARLVSEPIIRQAVPQPMPAMDPDTGLLECAWLDPYVLTIEARSTQEEWVSGVYLAKLTAGTSGAQAYIIFVVRDDGRPSDFLFQSSVTTYQAYNNWGGKSLYDFNSVGGRAHLVSFNRPYARSSNPAAAYGNGAGDFVTNNAVPPTDASSPSGWEYNMVRWLEREGYDVSYSTNIDTHSDEHVLQGHKGWLSVGHDEYWTWQMRAHVEAARDRGVNLAFFSGNVCYWQIRLEASLISGDPDRTIVSYKDDALKRDPVSLDGGNPDRVTVRWRDPPVNRPEEALIGVMYDGNPVDGDIVITEPDHWTMANTDFQVGERLPRLLGYEADRTFGQAPPGTIILARSPYQFEGQPHVAHMAAYTLENGTTVFAAGTIQWSWGLDDFNAPGLRDSSLNPQAQQITRNVLARFLGQAKIAPSDAAGRHSRGID